MEGKSLHRSRWGFARGIPGQLLPCILVTGLIGACSGPGTIWEQRLAEAPALDSGVTEEILPFGLWLPVHAKGELIAPLSVAYQLSLEGDPESALELVTCLAKQHPGQATLLAAKAALQRKLGYKRAAEHELTRALALDPSDADVAMGLAELRLELGSPSAAIEALGCAHDDGRDDAKLHAMLGTAWARLGQGRDARRHFDAAMERSPVSSVEVHLQAVDTMMNAPHSMRSQSGASRWVEHVLDEAAEIAPTNVRVWLLRGLFFEAQGEPEVALESLEIACTQAPWNRVAWTRLALTSLELQDTERFGRALEKVLSLEQDRHRVKRLAALSHDLDTSVASLDSQ